MENESNNKPDSNQQYDNSSQKVNLKPLSDQQVNNIVLQTQFGKDPKESFIGSDHVASKKQIQDVFDLKLSNPHTLSVLKHLNVDNGLELYKKYTVDQMKKKPVEKKNDLQAKVKSTTSQIEKLSKDLSVE